MRYEEFEPEPRHGDLFESLWLFTMEESDPATVDHVIVPDGTLSLSCVRIPGQGLRFGISGPSRQAHEIQVMKGAAYGGLRIRAGRAGGLISCDIQALTGGLHPLHNVAPRIHDLLAESFAGREGTSDLISPLSVAAEKIAALQWRRDDAICLYADRIMGANGDLTLYDAMTDLGVSPRQLRRRFAHQTGLTAKEFARLRRVRHACSKLVLGNDVPLTEASLESGFADQAHMAREFKDVFGASTSMVLRYLKLIRHGKVLNS